MTVEYPQLQKIQVFQRIVARRWELGWGIAGGKLQPTQHEDRIQPGIPTSQYRTRCPGALSRRGLNAIRQDTAIQLRIMEAEANFIRDIQDDRNGPSSEASFCNPETVRKEKKKANGLLKRKDTLYFLRKKKKKKEGGRKAETGEVRSSSSSRLLTLPGGRR